MYYHYWPRWWSEGSWSEHVFNSKRLWAKCYTIIPLHTLLHRFAFTFLVFLSTFSSKFAFIFNCNRARRCSYKKCTYHCSEYHRTFSCSAQLRGRWPWKRSMSGLCWVWNAQRACLRCIKLKEVVKNVGEERSRVHDGWNMLNSSRGSTWDANCVSKAKWRGPRKMWSFITREILQNLRSTKHGPFRSWCSWNIRARFLNCRSQNLTCALLVSLPWIIQLMTGDWWRCWLSPWRFFEILLRWSTAINNH